MFVLIPSLTRDQSVTSTSFREFDSDSGTHSTSPTRALPFRIRRVTRDQPATLSAKQDAASAEKHSGRVRTPNPLYEPETTRRNPSAGRRTYTRARHHAR